MLVQTTEALLIPLLHFLACTGPSSQLPVAPTATAGEVGTVFTVTAETPTPADARVEAWGSDGAVRVFPATPDADGLRHTSVIAGFPADETVTWHVVAEGDDGVAYTSPDQSTTTDAEPLWLPVLLAQPADATPGARFALTTVIGDEPAVAIVDSTGRYVWWWRPDAGTLPCQARMSADGTAVLVYLLDSEMREDIATIVRISLTGEEVARVRTPLGHHDFAELPDGSFGYLAFDVQSWDGQDTVGDALVRIDPATGESETLWSTWDDRVPTAIDPNFSYPLGADWSHANGVHYDADEGWLVSLHNLDAVVALEPDGAEKWQIGGEESDFLLEGGTPYMYQHSPVPTAAGLMVFDNSRPDMEDLYSRAVEYEVDPETHTYAQTWSYSGDEQLFSAFMGTAEPLPNGDVLIGWGAGGRIEEVTRAGEVVWQADMEIGRPTAFTHAVATLGEVLE